MTIPRVPSTLFAFLVGIHLCSTTLSLQLSSQLPSQFQKRLIETTGSSQRRFFNPWKSPPIRVTSTSLRVSSDELLEAIGREAEKSSINRIVQGLEDTFQQQSPKASDSTAVNKIKEDDPSRFDPLLDLYNVTYTVTAKENQNPVGGKWTRKRGLSQLFLNTRRTLQHVLTANSTGLAQTRFPSLPLDRQQSIAAEAVNVIVLQALCGLVRLSVILRGDAIPLTTEERKSMDRAATSPKRPLSNMALRVRFDPPRIVLGKRGRIVNLYIGPTSSVVLDATYWDDKVRIGMGGTSGTRFVFTRCAPDDNEANEFRALLDRKPMSKMKAIASLLVFAGVGIGIVTTPLPASCGPFCIRSTLCNKLVKRFVGISIATLSAAFLGLVLAGSGGIERTDQSYQQEKAIEAAENST